MKKFRLIQLLANVGLIAIAMMLIPIFVKYIFFSSPTQLETTSNKSVPPRPSQTVDPIGKTVPLDDIAWKENQKTLVMYLSTTCTYCKQSTPFYRKLVEEVAGKKVKLVTVFREDKESAAAYMKEQSIGISDIRSGRLNSIGVGGTPSLMLVDSSGTIVKFWRGKLNSESETQVVKALFGDA